MKIIATLILSTAFGCSAFAQIDTITNGGFEHWGNPSPGLSTEPTNWYSDKSGSSTATLGPQTCFQDNTAHSGSYSVQVITESIAIPIIGTEYINGVVTTGVVNAPSTSKADGYIGTINTSNSNDIRRMPFNGRPDSLVGWYQYTPHDGTERGKVRAILHIGNYFDPEVSLGTTTYHPNPIDSEVASALFLTDTPGTTVGSWTRFSVPFVYTTGLYASDSIPDYIMINVTSSANQLTSVAGSTLLLDDLNVIYHSSTATKNTVINEENVNVYSYENNVCVQFLNGENPNQSAITIMDITGRKVFSQTITNKLNIYNLPDLTTGVYFYQVKNTSYQKTGKIFIE